jgi:hypothetical protein
MLGQVLRAFEANVSIGATTTHRYSGENLRFLTEHAKSARPYLNPNWKPDESYFSLAVQARMSAVSATLAIAAIFIWFPLLGLGTVT